MGAPIADASSAGSRDARRAKGNWLRLARARLREGCREPITLGELAADVGRHPTHLSRAFRERWGMTPGEYLRRIRVAAAVRALREGDEPLSRVALRAGFADQSHMGRWVRRYLGTTPGALRGGRARPRASSGAGLRAR